MMKKCGEANQPKPVNPAILRRECVGQERLFLSEATRKVSPSTLYEKSNHGAIAEKIRDFMTIC